jgi:hypothetical protein
MNLLRIELCLVGLMAIPALSHAQHVPSLTPATEAPVVAPAVAPVVAKADPVVAKSAADDPQLAALLKQGALAVLMEADKRHTHWADQKLEVTMTTDKARVLKLDIFNKGTERRAIIFREPANLRDMRIVIKGTDEIYAKIPGNRKARRVAGHSRKQNLAGTQWDLQIGSMIRLAPFFKVKSMEQNATDLTMELVAKDGVDLNYPSVRVVIPRDSITIRELFYRDESGVTVKVETRSDLFVKEGSYTYKKVLLTNALTKEFTQIDVSGIVNDSGLKDAMFKKRWLERGM